MDGQETSGGVAGGWQGDLGRRWSAVVESMEAQLAPVSAIALPALDARPGQRIIDLGCGGGTTTEALARAVGQTGRVTAVDISEELAARARARVAGMAQAEVIVGDAAVHPFATGAYDALFSRFGCMFFEEPVAAFANLRAALKPGGRVVLVAWGARRDNPWGTLPVVAAETVLGPKENWPASPETGGPFAWEDPATVHGVLEGAGFDDVVLTPQDVTMSIGQGLAEDPVAAAVRLSIIVGPVARRMKLIEDATERAGAEAAYAEAVAERFAPLVQGDAVRLEGRFWLITARA